VFCVVLLALFGHLFPTQLISITLEDWYGKTRWWISRPSLLTSCQRVSDYKFFLLLLFTIIREEFTASLRLHFFLRDKTSLLLSGKISLLNFFTNYAKYYCPVPKLSHRVFYPFVIKYKATIRLSWTTGASVFNNVLLYNKCCKSQK